MGPSSRLQIRWDACLPRRFPDLACQLCIDICPTRALGATASGPELMAGCMECGRCVPACPNDALAIPGFAPLPAGAGGGKGPLAVDCWRVPLKESPPGSWRVPCLGGLTSADLAELTAFNPEEHGTALLDRGFCHQCPAGDREHPTGFPASGSLQALQGLLKDMGMDPGAWPRRVVMALPVERMRQEPGEPLLEERFSRRSLFAGCLGPTRLQAAPVAAGEAAIHRETPRQRLLAALRGLAGLNAALPARLFPQLTAGPNCAGHGVCRSVCPTGALLTYAEGSERGLSFDPSACNACGLCDRLCPEQALRLAPEGEGSAAATPRRLTRHLRSHCDECGAEHLDAGPCCPACRADKDFARDAFRTLFRQSA